MFRRPGKIAVLDKASLLPIQHDNCAKSINSIYKKIEEIPTWNELLAKNLQYKHDLNARTGNLFERGKIDENKFSQDIDNFTNYLKDLESAFKLYLSLAQAKLENKESARIRQVRFIKTGNVQKQIDKLLPDEKLEELAVKLANAYKKFFEYIQPIIISIVVFGTSKYSVSAIIGSDSIHESEEAYNYYLNFTNESIEVKSKWLHTLISPVLDRRNSIQEIYKSYLEEMKPNYIIKNKY